ncbi:MAG: NAD-dependent epimerase/dehydratase family protein, partial [Methylobacteriaceae bacterium]
MAGTALIAGVGGIVGNNLARHLVAQGWRVEGLARRPPEIAGVTPIAADLLDPAALARALEGHAPSHVFLTTWLRQPTEAENIRVNAAMVANLLDALRPAASLRHVAMVEGIQHYLGPFEFSG